MLNFVMQELQGQKVYKCFTFCFIQGWYIKELLQDKTRIYNKYFLSHSMYGEPKC